MIVVFYLSLGTPEAAFSVGVPQTSILAVCLGSLVLCSFIIFAALKMMRLEGYWAAMVAGVLAILVSPGNIVGLPVGLWVLLTLDRREVRNAFGVRKPLLTGPRAALFRLPLVVVRGGQRVTYWPGVLVSALIIAGLYVGAMTLVVLLAFHGDPLEKQFRLLGLLASTTALVVPLALGMWVREGHGTPIEELPHLEAAGNFNPLRTARWPWIAGSLVLLALLVFLATLTFDTKPNLLVSGTVTDAVTGKPIAGARVADNRYGATPNRAPQEAWTDAEGRFGLKTWSEEHTLSASAPGYEVKLAMLMVPAFGRQREARLDFQLQPGRTAGAPSFGPVIERVVNGEGDANQRFIDLDTGQQFAAAEFFGPKDEPSPEETRKWWQKTGIDAMGNTSPAVRGLVGFEMVAVPIASQEWDKTGRDRSSYWLTMSQPGTPTAMSGKGELPATYVFRTREGGKGLLQIIGFAENPPGVRIRYKLVQTRPAGDNASSTETGEPDRQIEKGDIRTVEINDRGVCVLGGVRMSPDQIETELKQSFQTNPRLLVYLRADENCRHSQVGEILKRLERIGIDRVSIRTEYVRLPRVP
jgi:biopolymer transport protein ExbD